MEVLRGSCRAGAATAADQVVKGSWIKRAPRSVYQGLAADPLNRGKKGFPPKSPLRRENREVILRGVPDAE